MNPCLLLATSIQFYFAHSKNIQLIVVEFLQQLRDSFALVEGMHSPKKKKKNPSKLIFLQALDRVLGLVFDLTLTHLSTDNRPAALRGFFLACLYSVRLKDFW